MAMVLIIDDRPMNLEFLCMILQYMKHQFLKAENGIEGLEKLKSHSVDLIISDILMPYIDGYEFARLVKLEPKYQHIPIIFYTAIYRKEEAHMLANDLGVQFVISKPADPQIIIDTINEALGVDALGVQVFPLLEQNPSQEPCKNTFDMDEYIQKSLEEIGVLRCTMKLERENLIAIENLVQGLQHYRDFNRKLLTVNELTFNMVDVKDPKKLLNLFCNGVAKLLYAEFGIVGTFESKGFLRYLALSSTLSIDFDRIKKILTLQHPWIVNIISHQSAFVRNEIKSDIQVYLSDIYQHTKNLIAVPLLTKNELYGFAYFFNKEKNDLFNEEDIQLVDSLAASMSIYYENIELYSLIQSQAAKLQIESSNLKRTQDELSKSEVMFRQFAENIRDVFWRTTAKMDKIIYVSPGYEEIWGRSIESIIENPQSWQEAIVEEDKQFIKKLLKKRNTNRHEDTFQFRIKKPDGRIRHIYNKIFAIKDEKGEINNIIGIASDITEYLQNQKRILLEKNVRKILERSASFNKAASKMLKLICEIFEWDMGEVWLLDEEEEILQQAKRWHKADNRFDEVDKHSVKATARLGEGLVGEIWKQGQPIWKNELAKSIRDEKTNLLSMIGLNNAIGFSLNSQDKVLGVMIFYSHQHFVPESDFIEILNMLGSRIGEFLNQKLTQAQLLQLAKQGSIRMLF